MTNTTALAFRTRSYNQKAVVSNFLSSLDHYATMFSENKDTFAHGALFLLRDDDYSVELVPVSEEVNVEPASVNEGEMVKVTIGLHAPMLGYLALKMSKDDLANIHNRPRQKLAEVLSIRLGNAMTKIEHILAENKQKQNKRKGDMNTASSPITFRSKPFDTEAVIDNFMASIARYHSAACDTPSVAKHGAIFLLFGSENEVEFIPLNESAKIEPENADEGDFITLTMKGRVSQRGFIAFRLRSPELLDLNHIPDQKEVIPSRLRYSIEKANKCIQKTAIVSGLATGIPFPEIETHNWRSDWPYVITLKDDIRIAAYPVHGKINEENQFCIGENCQEPMWYVSDSIVKHDCIDNYDNAVIIKHEHVKEWEPLG